MKIIISPFEGETERSLIMKYRSLALIVAVCCLGASHAFDTSYYRDATGKKQAALKTALYKIMGNPTTKNYGELWYWYYDTDRRSDKSCIDRYSNEVRYFSSQSGSALSGMNKEHGIAQSWWGGGTTGIGADLQHVMPSDTEANSKKSNYGMGVVTQQSWTNGSIKVGKGYAGNNGLVNMWEPADKWKGDFARIYFYIVTAYEEKALVQSEGANSMHNNTYPKLQPWAYQLYLEWAKNDPVDAIEIARNEAVYKIQSNRNPFIDYPGLEQYIWGDYQAVAFNPTNYQNPFDDSGLETPTASFQESEKQMEVGETYTQKVQTNSNGEVTYESSDPRVAKVDSKSGLVTAIAAGTAIITVTIAATAVYKATVASYKVKVGSGEQPGGDGSTYEKITTAPSDWSGTYLIVYEAEGKALDGSLKSIDAAGNYISVNIKQGTITVNEATEKAEVRISLDDGGYTIQGTSGLYIGTSSSKNTIENSETGLVNTFSMSGDGVSILSSQGTYMRFNTSADRFRYYKSGQQPVQLYRRTTSDGIGGLSANSKFKVQGSALYDLVGRKVSNAPANNGKLPKGLYIRQGKKYLVR